MSALTDILMQGGPAMVGQGWSRLGANLGAGPGMQRNAYQNGVMQGIQQESALEQARRRRDQNLGFAQINPQMIANAQSSDPNMRAQGQSELAAALIHAGENPNLAQVSTGLGNFQKQNEGNTIWSQVQGGASIPQINAELAAEKGEPLKLSGVEGNTIIDPYATPGEQAAVGGNQPTAVGGADITRAIAEAQQARAGAFRNSAEGQKALADINQVVTDNNGNAVLLNRGTGATRGVTDTGGNAFQVQPKGSAPGQMSDPKPEVLDQAIGKPKIGGAPNPTYEEFKTFQALHAQDDPQFNNGDYALAQYMLAKQGTQMAARNASPLPGFAAATGTGSNPNADADGETPDSATAPGNIAQAVEAAKAPFTSGASTPAKPVTPALAIGQTATNPTTGQKVRWDGQAWTPVNGG